MNVYMSASTGAETKAASENFLTHWYWLLNHSGRQHANHYATLATVWTAGDLSVHIHVYGDFPSLKNSVYRIHTEFKAPI